MDGGRISCASVKGGLEESCTKAQCAFSILIQENQVRGQHVQIPSEVKEGKNPEARHEWALRTGLKAQGGRAWANTK